MIVADWQPIVTAPKDGQAILLWDGFSVFEGFNNWSHDAAGRHDCWSTAALSPRPHTKAWMPLPEAPTQ
jgi:hypothetical protein